MPEPKRHGQWRELSIREPKSLANARGQCHHAVQLLTHVARGYIPAKDDDSHMNLGWDSTWEALMGRLLQEGERPFQLGLRAAELTLIRLGSDGNTEDSFDLNDRTWSDAAAWVRAALLTSACRWSPSNGRCTSKYPPSSRRRAGVRPGKRCRGVA